MKWRNDFSPGSRAGDGYVGEGGTAQTNGAAKRSKAKFFMEFPQLKIGVSEDAHFGLQDHTCRSYLETPDTKGATRTSRCYRSTRFAISGRC